MNEKEIECDNTVDEIVCPYCGYKDIGCLHEYFGDNQCETEIDCVECGKTFNCVRDFTVDYSTSKLEG